MTDFSQTFLIPLFFLLFFDRYQASVFDNLNTSHNLAFSLIVAILSILFIYFVFSILFDLIVKKKKNSTLFALMVVTYINCTACISTTQKAGHDFR